MDPFIGAVSVAFMLLLVMLGVHVGLALGLTGFLGLWFMSGNLSTAIQLLATTPYAVVAVYALSVLPLFILMGIFAGHAGLAEDAYHAVNKWVGRLPGGLAIATVGANAIFGAACGSSMAACAVFTKFSFPQMKSYGYQDRFALSSIAAAGVLAMLIPPSVLMILYGIVTEVSIAALFIGGIFPGLLLAAMYSIGIILMVKLNPSLAPRATITATWKDRFISLKDIWGIILLMVVVLGGIYAGIFTPTEAGAAGAFGAFILALAMRKLTLQTLWSTMQDAGQTTAMAFFIIIGAQIYSRFLALSGFPVKLVELIQGAGLPPLLLLAAFMLIYLFLGCILDSFSIMLITLPLIFPVTKAMGWDPVWFGLLVVTNIEVGLLTPPVGLNVFVVKAAAGPDVELMNLFRGVVPFFFIMLLMLALLVVFPSIVTFLPGLMRK